MSKAVNLARRHGLDMLTFAVLSVSTFLLTKPLREKWTQHRAEVSRTQTILRKWEEIEKISSSLSSEATTMQLVEISDYECPFCRKASAAVDSAVKGGLKISYLNYPLPSHQHAEGAALAALCAGFSGRFREMHEQLMNSSDWLRDGNWTREARAAGVPDLQKFEECLGGSSVRLRLADERALADSIGVHGTPSFISRRSILQGTASTAQLVALDRER